MSQRSRQSTRPSPSKSAQWRPVAGVLVADGWPAGVRVLVADGAVADVGVRVGVLVEAGAVVGVRVGVFAGGRVFVGAIVFVGAGVFVGTGVLVGAVVAVRVGVRVDVDVGVRVGVAVGSGPIQIVTLVDDCWKLLPVASRPMVCEPRLIVDELRVNDGPVPRNPFWDDVQKSWPLTRGVPSESAPLPVKVMTVLSGMTAPLAGDEMFTDGGPTATAETDPGVGASMASDADRKAARNSSVVRTATPIVNWLM
jgi:hypothetical protein